MTSIPTPMWTHLSSRWRYRPLWRCPDAGLYYRISPAMLVIFGLLVLAVVTDSDIIAITAPFVGAGLSVWCVLRPALSGAECWCPGCRTDAWSYDSDDAVLLARAVERARLTPVALDGDQILSLDPDADYNVDRWDEDMRNAVAALRFWGWKTQRFDITAADTAGSILALCHFTGLDATSYPAAGLTQPERELVATLAPAVGLDAAITIAEAATR